MCVVSFTISPNTLPVEMTGYQVRMVGYMITVCINLHIMHIVITYTVFLCTCTIYHI